jgi:hypothetical protein
MYIKRVIFRRLEQPLVKPINQAMENLIFLWGFFTASWVELSTKSYLIHFRSLVLLAGQAL